MNKNFRFLTTALLDHLADHGKMMIDAFFPKYYPGTGMVRQLFGLDRVYPSASAAKRSLSSLLNRLKKEGLVTRSGPKKKTIWTITKSGRKYLQEAKTKTKYYPAKKYHLEPLDNILRLVSFDVPEKEYRKRGWLRTELLACGFKSLHKSVYLGLRPLPQELFEDLEIMGMTKYVHIVSVNKKGTL